MKLPLVSVIIPTKNEQSNIIRCLTSLKNQRYGGPIEVIIIDNFSSDSTADLVNEFMAKYSKKLAGMVMHQSGPERSGQRNLGAKLAKGSYLLFMDADMEASAGVVSECIRLATNSLFSPMIVVREEAVGYSFWGRALALEKNCYKDLNWIQAARFFPKKLFLKIDGYDPMLRAGEDWDLTERLSDKGVPILMTKESVLVHHEPRESIVNLLKKEAYYINSMNLYVRKQPRAFSYQGSLLYRGLIYARVWQDLVAHPLLAMSFLSYKITVWIMWQFHKSSQTS